MNPISHEYSKKSAETLSAFGFEIFHYPEGDLILNTQLGIDPDEFMQQKPWISRPRTQWFKRGSRLSDRLVYDNDIRNIDGDTSRIMVKTKSNMMTARLLQQVKNKFEADSTSVTTIVSEEETGDELVDIPTNALYEVTPQNYFPSDLDSSGVDRKLRANASVLNEIMMPVFFRARTLHYSNYYFIP